MYKAVLNYYSQHASESLTTTTWVIKMAGKSLVQGDVSFDKYDADLQMEFTYLGDTGCLGKDCVPHPL